jgi:hypothetical protein
MSRVVLAVVAVVLVVTACASGDSGASPSGASPPGVSISTTEKAAERVAAAVPPLTGIGPRDPEVIGGCCFWEGTRTDAGFRIVYEVGWGDCPSGCIDRHRWTYEVSRDGAVSLIEESGPPVPAGVPGAGAGPPANVGGGGILPGGSGITGRAVAGPTCPVVTENNPACDDRPLAGLTVLILDASGNEVGRVMTDSDGRYSIPLPAGPYTVEPQPAPGVLGTPQALPVTVGDGLTTVDLEYDTGIR